ncbi:uncharacterized protein LOC117491515 [Trematomus bernacchii]|uniref:uncharacterized protein LOC117491515 n=1 Tax=Trematomus bernacchii TaxID=40690 RepID=UPI00146D92A1|nr:uncharacterized protein LOC117491515 [Trematomus bernacchii]
MYVVPTWKSKTADTLASFPGLPHQTTGNDCGVFILMYALNFSTDAPLWFTERDIAQIRKWWCIMLMERYQIEGHGQRFSYWTNEARELLKGALEPVYRVPKKRKTEHEVQFQKSDMCFILELPNCVLAEILMEMVLQEGDKAYSTLALVCTTFRDTMSTVSFRRGAHFRWLESVATWSWFSASYKEDFNVMYTVDTCRGCLELYKNCKPGRLLILDNIVYVDMEDMEVFPSESSDQQDCLYELPHSLVAGRWP